MFQLPRPHPWPPAWIRYSNGITFGTGATVEYLNLRKKLCRDPRVLRMARDLAILLGLQPTESLSKSTLTSLLRSAAIGWLFQFWSWAEEHVQPNDELRGITPEDVDIMVDCPRWTSTLSTDWLRVDSGKVYLPGFYDKTNGKPKPKPATAKEDAKLAARRQRERDKKQRYRERKRASHVPGGHPVDMSPPVSPEEERGSSPSASPFPSPPTPPSPIPPSSPSASPKKKRAPSTRVHPVDNPQWFDAFWEAYPRKVARRNAVKAWVKIPDLRAAFPQILAALERHKKSEQWLRDCGAFIPYPATWLNGRRWEDQVQTGGKHGANESFRYDPARDGGTHGEPEPDPEETSARQGELFF